MSLGKNFQSMAAKKSVDRNAIYAFVDSLPKGLTYAQLITAMNSSASLGIKTKFKDAMKLSYKAGIVRYCAEYRFKDEKLEELVSRFAGIGLQDTIELDTNSVFSIYDELEKMINTLNTK